MNYAQCLNLRRPTASNSTAPAAGGRSRCLQAQPASERRVRNARRSCRCRPSRSRKFRRRRFLRRTPVQPAATAGVAVSPRPSRRPRRRPHPSPGRCLRSRRQRHRLRNDTNPTRKRGLYLTPTRQRVTCLLPIKPPCLRHRAPFARSRPLHHPPQPCVLKSSQGAIRRPGGCSTASRPRSPRFTSARMNWSWGRLSPCSPAATC